MDSHVLFQSRLWQPFSDPFPVSKQLHSGLTTWKNLHLPPKGLRIPLESAVFIKGPTTPGHHTAPLKPSLLVSSLKSCISWGIVAKTLI